MIPRHKFCLETAVAHCHAYQNQYDSEAAAGGADDDHDCDDNTVNNDPWIDPQSLRGRSDLCTVCRQGCQVQVRVTNQSNSNCREMK